MSRDLAGIGRPDLFSNECSGSGFDTTEKPTPKTYRKRRHGRGKEMEVK